jgi:hypothetical protein
MHDTTTHNQMSALKTGTLANAANVSLGKTTREILMAVYEKYNPSKLGEIDKVLLKYAGQEELMLRNLAKKYNINHSDLGLKDDIKATGGEAMISGFGHKAPFGFGSLSNTSSHGGFGSLTQMGYPGSGLGANATTTLSASGGSGFGGGFFGSGSTSVSFASLGSPAGSNTPAFGTSTPFGAPRR